MQYLRTAGLAMGLFLAGAVPARAQPSYTYTTFDVPGTRLLTWATGINGGGEVVGFYDGGTRNLGFLFRGGAYTTLDVPGATGTLAYGLNSAGQVVGYYQRRIDERPETHGFLWSGGAYTTLDPPDRLRFNRATGINDRGQVVGWYEGPGGVTHGYLLSGGQYTRLDVPGAFWTEAWGINNLGDVVGNYFQGVDGFLLRGGVYTLFGVPGARGTLPRGINDAGQVVGWYTDDASVIHGFLRSGDAYTTLDPPGSIATEAWGINASGQIVGVYYDGIMGYGHGFLATPVPAPATLLLLGVGTLGLLGYAWKRWTRRRCGPGG